MPLPVYVLIGGGSRRFGADKASCEVDGEPWALHVGRRLADRDEAITLVGTRRLLGTPRVRLIADHPGGAGPLAGALAALDDRHRLFGQGLLVLASCDLVRPEVHWIESLIDAHEQDDELEVAAYRLGDRWQPFPMVVHTRWRERLRDELVAGQRSFQSVLSGERCHAEPWTGAPGGPPQANTPAELACRLGADQDGA